jgi:hypothetical protein
MPGRSGDLPSHGPPGGTVEKKDAAVIVVPATPPAEEVSPTADKGSKPSEAAGMTIAAKDAKGNVIQRRYYGADGRAEKNIDFGHDHTGVGDPHAHDWDWSKPKKKRQPPRALSRANNHA